MILISTFENAVKCMPPVGLFDIQMLLNSLFAEALFRRRWCSPRPV